MKKIVGIIFFLSTAFVLHAQEYQYSLGARFGIPFGITGKYYVNEVVNYELIFSSGWGGAGLTGLIEISNETSTDENLKWFYGFGAHIGLGNGDFPNPYKYEDADGVLGIDGIIGLEYYFTDFPVSISLDYIPSFNLIGDFGFGSAQIGISGRYHF